MQSERLSIDSLFEQVYIDDAMIEAQLYILSILTLAIPKSI